VTSSGKTTARECPVESIRNLSPRRIVRVSRILWDSQVQDHRQVQNPKPSTMQVRSW